MDELRRIYAKNLFFTGCVICIGFISPYTENTSLAAYLLVVLVLALYGYIGKLLMSIVSVLGKPKSSMHELKFLVITLATTCASGYFYIGIIDPGEKMISGLREIGPIEQYQIYTLDGCFTYFQDLIHTYLNSLYYSIVVMATLGDSNIVAEGGFTRIVVAFEVGTALTLTVFTLGEYYSGQSSLHSKAAENRIIEKIDELDPSYICGSSAGIFKRVFKLTKLCSRHRKARG
ncbi:two pore domain potassium channel family protein [Pseudomaricurvus alcaniphilus]|uniref:ion channel n=1 Tax=Pseudomaricurvus alcaniphilus TaxID=1166482 RepID=UPI00140DC921|nr:ion channel [Pseudomaricurvus alcaniphilus]NHN37203.1 two pore domain potassium channel family protein [Pseudomaricurvus alcaniphilus]